MEAIITLPKTEPAIARRRVAFYGLARQKYCMNCGKLILEEKDLYSRRFCSTDCKDEYCSPIKTIVKKV